MIDAELDRLVPDNGTLLHTAARYMLLAPGKRLRPRLVLATAQMLGASLPDALPVACALEMIHTYSLIHDDLPCMDDDDFRRGRPSLHKAYDEGIAVLTGDFLLTYAFQVISEAPLSAHQKCRLIAILSRAAGGEGMIGGQVLDIEGSADIEQMHSKKTACLFQAAVECGALIAGVEHPELAAFGHHFGLFYQALDDWIDQDHPLGARAASDATEQTYLRCLEVLEKLREFHTLPLKELLIEQYAFCQTSF